MNGGFLKNIGECVFWVTKLRDHNQSKNEAYARVLHGNSSPVVALDLVCRV